jgi:myo-inositol 2-dehydrogenase/D-chiro-inositol 1-dehydrogenase
MATSLADCDAMIEACRAAGTVLTVGHQRRWNPSYRAARDAIRAGAIGRLINGYAMWSTGRVGSVGTHYFDALNMVVDDTVAWVSGRLDPASQPQPQWPDILDPGGMGTLVYRNGARITVDAMEDTHSSYDVYLFGTRGQLHVLRDGREFRYWAHDEEVPARQMYSQGPPIPAREPPAAPTTPRPEDWQVGLEELLECIGGQREPASTGAHGRHALEVIAALHLSSRNNMQPVSLPLTGDAVQLDLKFR